MINLAVSFVAGFLRAIISVDLTSSQRSSRGVVGADVIFNVLVFAFQLLSGVLLLYSLLKISNGVENVPGAKKKQVTFISHFAVLTCHLISLAVCEFYIQRGFAVYGNPKY